ncbi:NUDIX hydrolase [Fredinandcohnia humi]
MKQYVVGLVFDKEMEQVLLLKRSKMPYQGLYNGVGGKVEDGEEPSQAMYRELQEETGLQLAQMHTAKYITSLQYPSGIQLVVYYFVLREKGFPLPIGNEIDEGRLEWVSITNQNLLDASNPYLAGDGNISYFIHFARTLQKKN